MSKTKEALKMALDATSQSYIPYEKRMRTQEAIREAIAEQEQEQEPLKTAMDVTIEGDTAKFLRELLKPDNDFGNPPVRIMLGVGHSGYGLYVCDANYPEEGAELLANTQPIYTYPAPANQQAMGITNEQDAFDAAFKLPPDCTRFDGGYAATEYNAWRAHAHVERWAGWKARAMLAAAPEVPAPLCKQCRDELSGHKLDGAACGDCTHVMEQQAQAPAPAYINCKAKRENGGVCPHHNLQCGWPKCNEAPAPAWQELSRSDVCDIAHRRCTRYYHDPHQPMYTFTGQHLMDFIRDVRAKNGGAA